MLTYYDLVEHLITASFGGPQDAEQKDIRASIHRAVHEVAYIRDWRWYHTHGRIVFDDTWTGTVTYSKASRTIYRQTGDPFPLYAANSRLRISEVVTRVDRRVDNDTLTADATISHPESLIVPVSAILYRSFYPLPEDFRSMDSPIDQDFWTHFVFVEPDLAMKMEIGQDRQGPPHAWTVRKDPDSSRWAIQVIGYPVEVETLDFTYRRVPRTLRLSGHEATSRQGTVSCSGSTVTGVGTAFTAGMVGSMLRFGTAAELPDTLGSMNPFQFEAKIVSVSSATSCEIDDTYTASGVKYLVTDPVDSSPSMENCIYSAAEYWLARTRGTKADDAFALYQRDLRLALESDQVAPLAGSQRVIWDTTGWRTPLKSDNFDGGGP